MLIGVTRSVIKIKPAICARIYNPINKRAGFDTLDKQFFYKEMIGRNQPSTLSSWKLHQLAKSITDSPKDRRQTIAALQEAYMFAKNYEAQEHLLKTPLLREVEGSVQVAKIAATEMSLDLSAAIASLLTPAYLTGHITPNEIKNKFGQKVASILIELMTLQTHMLQQHSIYKYSHLLDRTTPSTIAVLLQICEIIRLYRSNTNTAHDNQDKKFLFELKHFYIPSMHRMQLYDTQAELADLWLKYADTLSYYTIIAQLGMTKYERKRNLEIVSEEISVVMQKHKINFFMKKRIKSVYSIWRKMKKLKVDFDQIHDLSAIRIILTDSLTPIEEKKICWKVLSIISGLYKPIHGIMRDWISIPKNNNYESLHLTFKTDKYGELEIQIRTERMDHIAEYGEAAHWKYKFNGY